MSTKLAPENGSSNTNCQKTTTGSNDEILQSQKINAANLKAIDKFFGFYADETKEEYSKLFVDLLGDFVVRDVDASYNEVYKEKTALQVRILNDFIQALKIPLHA